MLAGRVRHRLHALQAEHGHAAHRAAARSSRAPSDIDEYVERLRREPRRARRPLPRSAHRRDALLPQRGGVRRPRASASCRSSSRRAPTDAPFRVWVAGCATGEEVVLARDPAPRARARASASGRSRSSRPTCTAARSSARRAASTTRRPSRTSRRSASSATSSRRGETLPGRARAPADGRLRAAQRDQGRAVHARRPRQLPQPAHLPAAGGAAEGALPLSLRAQPRRRRLPRPEREPGRAARTTSRPSTSTGGSTASTATSRIAVDARAAAARDRRRGSALPLAAPAAPARHSIAQLLGTYDALLDEFMPPSLLVERPRRARPRLRRREPFPAAARRAPGPRRPRRGRRRAASMVARRRRCSARSSETSPLVFKGVRVAPTDDSALQRVTIRRVAARTGGAAASSSRSRRREASPTTRRPTRREIDLGAGLARAARRARGELSHTKENLQAAIEELETSNEELQAVERRAARLERGAAEHERGAPERQRGALHRQRRVPAQDRRADRAHERHGQPPVEHRRRHDLPRPAAPDPEVHAADRRELQPRAARRRPTDRDVRARHRPPGAGRRPPARARDRRARSSASSARIARPTSFFLRILPYRAKGAIDGVVLTLIDVSGLKAAEDALFHERYLLNSLLAQRARRDLLQGRARALHPRQRRDGGAPRPRRPARGRRQDGARAARPGDARSRCTSRTSWSCAPARRSTTGSRSARRPTATTEWDLVTRLPLRDRGGRRRRHHRRLPRRHRAEARRGEDPGGRAAARSVPRDALARAAQPARRDRHGDVAPADRTCAGDERRAAARRSSSASRSRWRACSTICSRSSRVTQNKIELRKERRRPPDGVARSGRRRARADGGARPRRSRARSPPSRSGSTATRRACSRSR